MSSAGNASAERESEGRRRGVLEERLGLEGLDYEIPREAGRVPYMLGGLTAFLLLVLVLTGLYLAQFYAPDPLAAHDSVLYIMTRAPLGDWVRSLHYWASGGVVVTVTAHLAWVFWRRSYLPPREVTWWAGVGMAGLLFLLVVTGTSLRWDQEGWEALAHYVAGGELMGPLGAFFTEGFIRSTPLLTRVFSLHTSLLPLALLALVGLHFWLIRRLGIHSADEERTVFRHHLTRLSGVGLLALALLGVLAAVAPEGLGYPPVQGVEITKPFWPVLWVYGLENIVGMWGIVLGPAVVFGFLAAVPLLDRGGDGHEPGGHGWVGWAALLLALAVLGLGLYAFFGETQQHLGM